MGKRNEDTMSSASSMVSVDEYAPSPSTYSQALTRANQLRVQALLRQLLMVEDHRRLDTLRVLRKTIRELDYHLSWLTQVDFFETLERILREENEARIDWRHINDCTKLLIESIPRFPFDVDPQTVGQIFANVIQNLGHQRSEVRRSSLLLINMYINERPAHFQQILKLFIDYGLANYRNQQAQRGAILSLPLLMTEQVVEGEDLLPLIKCLSELLVDANSQLFYSLYLALQRLHLTVGDQQFAAYLSQCDPEAILLYKQAASRNNSLISHHQKSAEEISLEHMQQQQQQQQQQSAQQRRRSSIYKPQVAPQDEQFYAEQVSEPKQVTFENDELLKCREKQQNEAESSMEQRANSRSSDTSNGSLVRDIEDESLAEELIGKQPEQISSNNDEQGSTSSEKSFNRNSTGSIKVRSSIEQSSVSSTCSSQANLVDPSHYMNAAALNGRPLSGYEQIHHVDHSNTGLAINDLGVCCTPTIELGPAAQNELKFGIFPRHLVTASLNSRYPDRLEALQEMMCIIRDSPINHLAILMTYFDSFLEQFLARLMEPGTDYKVELIAIDMIETIVIKTKVSTMQFVRPMISLLIRTLGDSRLLFRDNTIRVIHKMMAFLPPQHVIDAIFEHKHNKSALVREESVNRVTAAVLEYDRNEFNLTKLCYHVLPMLADHHANVRLASLECIASLAHALGPERIGSLLTAAEAVQTGCDYDGLLDAIHARLMRRTLPRCNSDGSIRYVIKPFLNLANANFHQEHQAADVRWVLEAPSSHQHVVHTHQPAQQQSYHTHAHKAGVYSPPDVSNRRSSLSLYKLTGTGSNESIAEYLHHHGVSLASNQVGKQQQQQQQQQQHQQRDSLPRKQGNPPENFLIGSQADRNVNCMLGSPKDADLVHRSGPRKSSKAYGDINQDSNKSETNKKQQTKPVETLSPSVDEDTKVDETVGHYSAKARGAASKSRRQSVQDKSKAIVGNKCKRSNSQDSSSSTDTSKFKQSLTETGNGTIHSVLPSDSIIYTDTVQAYALSRCQSRYQQTSFDYDSDSVGRVPTTVGPLKRSQENYGPGDSQGNRTRHLSRGERQEVESSGSESPQTIMEATKEQSQVHQAAEKRGSAIDLSERRATMRHLSSEERLDYDSSDGRQKKSTDTKIKEPNIDSKRQSIVSGSDKQRQQLSQQQESQTDEEAAKQESRRKSVARKDEHQIRDRIDECDIKQGRQKQQQQQRHQHQDPQASQESGSFPGTMRLQKLNAELVDSPSIHQIPKQKSNLTRQSVSLIEDDISGSNSSLMGSVKLESDDNAPRKSFQMSVRQESTATTDSQSSQRESSDHATQTVPQQSQDTTKFRESRRRSSRRLSSSKHESTDEVRHHNNGDKDEDADAGESRQVEHQDLELRRRASRSQPPVARSSTRTTNRSHLAERSAALDTRRAVSVSPSLASSVNIRHILENVAEVEGPFQETHLAFKVAMDALEGPCWSTKVEGMLALIRLTTFHQPVVTAHLHEIVCRVADETRNLRSTVARSAIFVLGDLSAKIKRSIEPELDTIVQALLQKSIENTEFIRDDIRRTLTIMVDHLTPWRMANALINHGANHKNMQVRRMSSQFVASLVEKMGTAKCLVGARDISAQLIPAAAKFAQDSSPHTRYFGRLILAKIMQHSAFERLLRKNLAPNLYRSTIGIIESVKRRGAGDPPAES